MTASRPAVEVGTDGTRIIFHRLGNQSWTHPEGDAFIRDRNQVGPCPACITVDLVAPPLPPGKYGPVKVVYDATYGGFLGYEVMETVGRRGNTQAVLYSSLDTLPAQYRSHVSSRPKDQFCVESGCLNRPERRGRCRTHRGERNAA